MSIYRPVERRGPTGEGEPNARRKSHPMPCFSPLIGEWAATDSAPYQQALADVEKLKHRMDAYLEMAGMCRPDGTRAELPGVRRADDAQPFDLGLVKGPLMPSLAQHCLCDGIGFYQLYELQSPSGSPPPQLRAEFPPPVQCRPRGGGGHLRGGS